MLIPQFSIRWILGLTTVCALFALLVHAAVRGQVWAAAVAMGIGFLVFLMCVQATCFAGVWMFSQVLTGRGKTSREPANQVSPAPAPQDRETSA